MPQKPAPFSRKVIFVTLGIVAATSLSLWGAQLAGDISEDSEIILVETHASISTFRVTTKASQTVVSLDRDGEVRSASMPNDECHALWDYCLSSGVDELVDARPEPLPPDLSVFTLTFRIGDRSHTFTVHGVDFLDDTRYRDIVRRILDVCQTYVEE